MPDFAALNVLNRFSFWSAVPLDGSATFPEIASHVSLPEEVVRRVMEHGFNLRIFEKTDFDGTPGVRHTSRSAALVRSPGLSSLVSTILDDAGPPMTVLQEALARHNSGKEALEQDMSQTAFTLYNSGDLAGKYKNSWEFIENDGDGERKGWRQRNFVQFMDYLKEIFRLESVVEEAYDWKAAGNAKIVDVSDPPHPFPTWLWISVHWYSCTGFPLASTQGEVMATPFHGRRPASC